MLVIHPYKEIIPREELLWLETEPGLSKDHILGYGAITTDEDDQDILGSVVETTGISITSLEELAVMVREQIRIVGEKSRPIIESGTHRQKEMIASRRMSVEPLGYEEHVKFVNYYMNTIQVGP